MASFPVTQLLCVSILVGSVMETMTAGTTVMKLTVQTAQVYFDRITCIQTSLCLLYCAGQCF